MLVSVERLRFGGGLAPRMKSGSSGCGKPLRKYVQKASVEALRRLAQVSGSAPYRHRARAGSDAGQGDYIASHGCAKRLNSTVGHAERLRVRGRLTRRLDMQHGLALAAPVNSDQRRQGGRLSLLGPHR
jgi:hypothetical protein